jgi:hypothetical protein
MKRLEEFRIYYNKTIYPELMRLERRRRRLLRLLLFSVLILGGVVVFQLYLRILVISLVLMIPVAVYMAYLLFRIREFIRTFKPNVMNLVLDFIDDGPNRGTLHYAPERMLEKDRFLSSRLFVTPAPFYEGEDYINGRVGEMNFELCELDVREISPVLNRLNTIFKGAFLYAIFPEETEGTIAIWPREQRQFHTRSIREFTWMGGKNVDYEIMNNLFRQIFLTYATEDTHVAGILTEPMQEALVQYVDQTGKDIYVSFFDQEIYIAVTEEKDILEPYILRSNLSFELVREFFEDVNLLLQIVEEFDRTH